MAENLVAKRVKQKLAEIGPVAQNVFGKAKPSLATISRGVLLLPVRKGDVLETQRLVGVGDDDIRRSGSTPRLPEPGKKVQVSFAAKVSVQIENGQSRNGEFDQRVVALSLEGNPPAPLDGFVGKMTQVKLDRVQV